jgi:GT2 family glycosyltransferase
MDRKTQSAGVLIVVVNYNGGALVRECIASCLDQTYKNSTVVIVDNGSTDGSAEELFKAFPHVPQIKNGYNAGWAAGCTKGIAYAGSAYVAVVNSDAVLDRACIAEMAAAIESAPRVGSVASRIMLYDRRDTVEACGLSIAADGSSCARGRLRPAYGFLEAEEVFCASDCCCLFKREMLDDIGGYDEDFFMYCNDTDIGFRQQLSGWKALYAPAAAAYHYHSRAAGSYSAFKAFYVERNRICVVLKCFPAAMLVSAFALSWLRYACQVFLSFTKKKGSLARFRERNSLFSGFIILCRAHFAALSMAPAMLKKRRQVLAKRTIRWQEFRRLFSRFGIGIFDMASYE